VTVLVKMEGFDFCFDPAACRNCGGRCCRGKSGHIWVNAEEMKHIAAYLRTNTVDLVAAYLLRVGNRLSIRERKTDEEFACMFFDEQNSKCTIYEVRPSQCRQFPFWDYFKNHLETLIRECPGVKTCERAAGPQGMQG